MGLSGAKPSATTLETNARLTIADVDKAIGRQNDSLLVDVGAY